MHMAAFAIALGALLGAATEPDPAPRVEDLAWLAGHWRGEGFGGTVEEIWSEPAGGTMVGTFRLLKQDAVQFYEIFVLVPDGDGLVLKVKHFDPQFVGWEEKDGSVDFPFESAEGHTATFSGLKFRRDGDALEIEIRMRYADGATRWETLSFTRRRP